MAKYNSLDSNNPVKQTIEKARQTFMEALKKNLEKGALYAGAMFLGALMLYNNGMYAEAASVPALDKTSYSVEMSQSNTVTVKLKLNTSRKVKIIKGSGIKSIKSTKQSGKTITVKMNVAKAGTCELKVSRSGMKTSTAKIKVTKAAKADHNITSTVDVAGYSIGLGMSASQVESALASYGSPVYKGSGCQSYDTECWYYQKNGSQTSFMIEFYKGAVERILFSSPKWSNGGLSNETKASTLSMSSKSYTTANGSVTAKQYTESKGKVSFTAYLDNAKEWKNVGWYLCELKDTGVTHSGKNSLANQTKDLSFDLSMFDTNSTFQKKYKKITKDKVIAACSKANLLDLEKGKQNVYLTNMYRAYHGLELAAYSEHSSEYAYVNAKVRSMAKESFHADFFEGEFAHQALQKTIKSERMNEWWGGWQETFSENAGYESGADAITVLRGTVASTGHLENVLSGNFAIGAAIVDGYDTVETIGAALMDADEIAEAQGRVFRDIGQSIHRFWEYYGTDWVENQYHLDLSHIPFDKECLKDEYKETIYYTEDIDGNGRLDDVCCVITKDVRGTINDAETDGITDYVGDVKKIIRTEQGYVTMELLDYIESEFSIETVTDSLFASLGSYYLGITTDEVEAALYRDSYSVYTYNNLYELSYMDRETWVNFVLDKYELQGVKGAKEYVGIKHDEYTHEESNYIYNGKDAFYSIHQAWVDRGDLTASQLEEVYLHFCALEYDQEYTQALMSHFGCTAEQVYLEHSDILASFGKTNGKFEDMAAFIRNIASENNVPVKATIKMFVKAHTSWKDENKAYMVQEFNNELGA